jgi:hypothetical protein
MTGACPACPTCDACGSRVDLYATPVGNFWMHVDSAEAADCANLRGDEPWAVVPALASERPQE